MLKNGVLFPCKMCQYGSFYQVNGTYVGGGGAGAYGGNAAASTNSGGGGGSGYTNGSVNVLSTSSANALTTAFAQIELL